MSDKQSKRPILVPVDFSKHSEAALWEACELSESMGAPLVVLHVVHDPGDMPGYYTRVSKKKHLTRIEDAAAKMTGRGWGLRELTRKERTLEDIFVEVVGRDLSL